MGAKKFGMSLETQGIKLFWRDIPGFCRDIPEAPEKFEKKKFGFNFWPLDRLGHLQGSPVRFGYGLRLERFERFRFSALAAPLVVFCSLCFSTV